MFPITRTLIAITTTAASIVGITDQVLDHTEARAQAPSQTLAAPSAEPTDQTQTSITVHAGADQRWHQDIETAIGRFETAGLPAVVADIHIWTATDSQNRCHGHAGWFSTPNQRTRVDLCIDFHDTDLGTQLRDKLILHELAHAWIHHNVDQTTRHQFMELRGAQDWNDPDHTHTSRGTEIAANTIMFALHPNGPSTTDQVCGYELLTTSTTPNNHTDECATRPTLSESPAEPATDCDDPTYTGPAQLPGGVLPANLTPRCAP